MIRRNNFAAKCCVCSADVAPNTGHLYSQNDAVIEALRRGSAKWLTICAEPKCFAAFHGRTASGGGSRPALLADGTIVCTETEAALPYLRAMGTLELVDGRSRWRVLRNPGDRAHVLSVAAKLGLDVDPSWLTYAMPSDVQAMTDHAASLGSWAYQLDGIRFLATRASDDTMKGCLLADQPGLGKSQQTLLSLRPDEALVIIGPKSAASVWPIEIAKWCPERFDSVRVCSGNGSFSWPTSTREAVFVTYDILPYTKAMIVNERTRLLGDRNGVAGKATAKKQADKNGKAGLDPMLAQCEQLLASDETPVADRAKIEALRVSLAKKIKRVDADLQRNAARKPAGKPKVRVALVLDEVHRAANNKAKRTIAVRGMTTAATRVVALTGTPVEDDPFLLSSLLTTCCCNVLDRDLLLWGFHAHKLPHGGYEHEREPSTTPGAKGAIKVRPGIAELLRRVMLRRLKANVLADLPPKIFTEIPVDVDANMLASLDDLAADPEVKRLIVEGELPPFAKIAAVRGALATMLVAPTLALVEEYELQSCPLIVFAEHTAPIEALRNRDGWAVVTGSATTLSGVACSRDHAVAEFQAGRARGFAGTIAACGDAITLTRASTMHFVDLAYSHRLNTQAFDRCHRPGQRSCVNISTFVPDHPIARHVAAVLARKSDFAVAVLDSVGESSDSPLDDSGPLVGPLASTLDADASERRAVARARSLRLALPEVSLGVDLRREAESAVRLGSLSRAETAALAGLLPGALAGRPVALASAKALLWKT